MKLDDFISTVDNLVREWNTDDPKAGAIPRKELEAIYDKMREESAHELAEAIRLRQQAEELDRRAGSALAKLHKQYIGLKK